MRGCASQPFRSEMLDNRVGREIGCEGVGIGDEKRGGLRCALLCVLKDIVRRQHSQLGRDLCQFEATHAIVVSELAQPGV